MTRISLQSSMSHNSALKGRRKIAKWSCRDDVAQWVPQEYKDAVKDMVYTPLILRKAFWPVMRFHWDSYQFSRSEHVRSPSLEPNLWEWYLPPGVYLRSECTSAKLLFSVSAAALLTISNQSSHCMFITLGDSQLISCNSNGNATRHLDDILASLFYFMRSQYCYLRQVICLQRKNPKPEHTCRPWAARTPLQDKEYPGDRFICLC